MKIGNIVSEEEINIGPEFNYFNNIDLIDSGLPTLIIGYELTKTIFPDVSILDRKIDDNIFWTFTKKEYRKFFNNDIEDFIHYSIKSIVENIKTYYLDLIQENRLFTIVKRILEMNDLISFEHENVIYSYNKSKKLILIFDLNLMDYLGLDIEKIKNKIKSKSSVFLVGNIVLIEYINYVNHLDNKLKYIPFLYFINNHDKNFIIS